MLKSLEQAWTRRKIPFGRTPKVEGRTAAPARYILAEYVLLGYSVFAGGMDLLHGMTMHALFSFGNAAFLVYALSAFVGWRASIADLLSGLERFRWGMLRLGLTQSGGQS